MKRLVLPVKLFICLVLVFGLIPSASVAQSPFTVTKADGDVLHILDGQPPMLLKAGDKVTGGRLAVMEEASAEIIFPDGKSYPVPQNTLLALDPSAATLDNACAAAGGIRDQSVLILLPGDNQELRTGKPFHALIAINPALVRDTTLALSCTTLEDMKFTQGKVLLEFSTLGKKAAKPGMGDFILQPLEVPKAPAKEGDYKLFVRSVAGVESKKIGKDQTIILVKP